VCVCVSSSEIPSAEEVKELGHLGGTILMKGGWRPREVSFLLRTRPRGMCVCVLVAMTYRQLRSSKHAPYIYLYIYISISISIDR